VKRFGDATEPALHEWVAKTLVNKGATLYNLGRRAEAIAVCDDVAKRFGDATEPALREWVETALANKRATLGTFKHAVYQDLAPRQDQFMVAMPTGTSWRDNCKHGVYYEPVDRPPKWRRAAFLGLYHDKQVSHIGLIVTVVSAKQDGTGRIAFDKPEMGTIDKARQQAIQGVIEAAQDYYPDLGSRHHRYYVVDTFAPTEFLKMSPGGMMGHRYFDIEEISKQRLSPDTPGSVAAHALYGRSFL
jgi:hypothetical protein